MVALFPLMSGPGAATSTCSGRLLGGQPREVLCMVLKGKTLSRGPSLCFESKGDFPG